MASTSSTASGKGRRHHHLADDDLDLLGGNVKLPAEAAPDDPTPGRGATGDVEWPRPIVADQLEGGGRPRIVFTFLLWSCRRWPCASFAENLLYQRASGLRLVGAGQRSLFLRGLTRFWR